MENPEWSVSVRKNHRIILKFEYNVHKCIITYYFEINRINKYQSIYKAFTITKPTNFHQASIKITYLLNKLTKKF